jgi:hypothetical protein
MWLTANRGIMNCRHIFNKDWVTEVITDDASHAPFVSDIQIEEFHKWLKSL